MLVTKVLVALLLLVASASAQDYNAAPGRPRAAAGHTNYTATLDYCWMIYTSGDSAGGLNNPCTTGTDLSINAGNDAASWAITPPTGYATGKDAVDGDGAFSLTFADPGAEPTSWSFGCWLDEGTNTNDVAFVQADAGGAGINMRLKNSTAEIYDGSSGGGSVGSADGSAITGWRHVAITYDSANAGADSLRIYINGASAATGDGVNPGSVTQPYYIGSNPTPGSFWQGNMYECFYDFNVLSASQVCEISKYGLAGDADHSSIVGCTP